MMPCRTLPLLALAMLSACSPYIYNQEVAGFTTGVDTVVASYQSGQQAVDRGVGQQRQAADAKIRARLLLLPGCDQIDPIGSPPRLADCAVVAFGAHAAPAPTPVQRNLADAAPAFDAIRTYAAALSAVTASTDETSLTQATQTLTTAAGGLAKVLAKLKPATAASSLLSPVSSTIGQGIALYLDQRRLAALRAMVPAVDAAVPTLGLTLQAALADIRAQQMLQLAHDLRDAAEPLELASVSRLDLAGYQARLSALQAAVAAFNQARAADPAATIAALVNAHHKLAVALQANAGQAKAPLTGAQAFVTAATSLKTAIDAGASATAKPRPASQK